MIWPLPIIPSSTDVHNRYVLAPMNYQNQSTGQVQGVWLHDNEEVQWIYTDTSNGKLRHGIHYHSETGFKL